MMPITNAADSFFAWGSSVFVGAVAVACFLVI